MRKTIKSPYRGKYFMNNYDKTIKNLSCFCLNRHRVSSLFEPQTSITKNNDSMYLFLR